MAHLAGRARTEAREIYSPVAAATSTAGDVDRFVQSRAAVITATEEEAAVRSTEVSSAVRHIAEEAVTAEAARGRMRVRQLETALAESRSRRRPRRSAAAAAAAAAADCARRERQLNLQLEQLRDAAVQRDREAEQVNRERDRAERGGGGSAVEAEAAASRRVEGLQRQLDELDGARADRDALLIKVEQLGRLVEMQAAELKRLRDSKATADCRRPPFVARFHWRGKLTNRPRLAWLNRCAHRPKSLLSLPTRRVEARVGIAAAAGAAVGALLTSRVRWIWRWLLRRSRFRWPSAAAFEHSPLAAAASYGGLSPVDYPRPSPSDGTVPRQPSYGAISPSEDEEEGVDNLGESSE